LDFIADITSSPDVWISWRYHSLMTETCAVWKEVAFSDRSWTAC